jgi:hypothetical protein
LRALARRSGGARLGAAAAGRQIMATTHVAGTPASDVYGTHGMPGPKPGETAASAVSWAAIIAGALASCALTLFLLALGAGLGFSMASPWPGSGISARTAALGTGLYLVVVAMLASTVGGYLAGRLRTKWVSVHTDEVFFRDTAHGFVAWALATLLSVSVLGASGLAVVSAGTLGASAGLSQGAANAASRPGQASDPNASYVDTLFRTDPAAGGGANAGDPAAAKAEVGRILASSLAGRGDLSAADRTYVTQVIAARTGVSQQEADKRLTDVTNQARAAADAARKAAAKLSLWIAASMLIGAFAASLAAAEAGKLRDDD